MKTRSYIILAIVLVLTMLLAACGGGEPANKLEAIKEAGKIIVGTSADYPPYESKDEAGNFVGFDLDLIREVGKRIGVDCRDPGHGLRHPDRRCAGRQSRRRYRRDARPPLPVMSRSISRPPITGRWMLSLSQAILQSP